MLNNLAKTLNRFLTPQRVAFYAIAVLTVQCLLIAIWSIRYYVLGERSVPLNRAAPMVGSDFAVFWCAARVTIEHGAAAVFSTRWMQPLEVSLAPFKFNAHFAPWAYPPTFLLPVVPLGLLSFGLALVLFSMLGLGLYAIALSRVVRGLSRNSAILMACFPGIGLAILYGQNSLFTAAAALSGLLLLQTNPVAAGACIAALIVKPQLGVLFPVALICGRHWKALASATAFTVVYTALSIAIFGTASWVAFAHFLPTFEKLTFTQIPGIYYFMPTIFSMARALGLSLLACCVAQSLMAISAISALGYLWLKPARFDLRAAGLCAATLLVQPYLLYYDLAWLAIPLSLLMRDAKVKRMRPTEYLVLSVAWLLPSIGFLATVTDARGDWGALVLVALLAVIVRRSLATDDTDSR